MLNVVKEKLELSPDLRKKINWASKYTSTSITLEKGALIKLEPTNIAYVDPHKVIINNSIHPSREATKKETVASIFFHSSFTFII